MLVLYEMDRIFLSLVRFGLNKYRKRSEWIFLSDKGKKNVWLNSFIYTGILFADTVSSIFIIPFMSDYERPFI